MMNKIKILAFALIASLFSFNFSASASESFHGKNSDWRVYSTIQDGVKYCYAVTGSKKESGNFKKRGEPYLLVTHRKNGVSEVSVSSGYPYKQKSTVAVVLDNKSKFDLFTTSATKEIAWAKDANDDKRLIQAMKRGYILKAKGYSRIGSYSVDEFSLSGFTKSYNQIVNLCK